MKSTTKCVFEIVEERPCCSRKRAQTSNARLDRKKNDAPPSNGVDVSEPLLEGANGTLGAAVESITADGILQVGETWTYTGSYTAQQADIDNNSGGDGDIDNTATVSSDELDDETSSAQVPIDRNAAITIDKVTNGSDGGTYLVGSGIVWTYTVTNTGNVSLTGVDVTDDQGVTPTYKSGGDGNNVLDISESWVFEASGTATVGAYHNTGTVDTDHDATDSDDSCYFGADPQIAIDKRTLDGTTTAGAVATAFAGAGDGASILTGETVTWIYKVTNAGNVALDNVSVTDNVSGVTPAYLTGDDGDNKLESGETWYYKATGTATAGSHSNIGTATGKFTDSAGHTGTDTATDGSSYLGADPQISIVKTTIDSHGQEGDGIAVLPGEAISWKYVVTSTGTVPLSNIQVSDNVLGDIDANANTVLTKTGGDTDNLLEAGETWTYKLAGTAVGSGSYHNTGTASGQFTDTAGHTRTDKASDDSSYFVLKPAVITDSSLCDFGDVFKLIFTPNFAAGTNQYKLSDSNPGQFYYNLFHDGEGAAGSTTDVTINIPYPFVTQGATAVHAYSSVTVDDHSGQTCFTPGDEIANWKPSVTLGSYTDTNHDGKIGFGDTYALTVHDVPDDEFVYLNLHLDYGLEKSNGWAKNGENAANTPAVNPSLSGVTIKEGTCTRSRRPIPTAPLPGAATQSRTTTPSNRSRASAEPSRS